MYRSVNTYRLFWRNYWSPNVKKNLKGHTCVNYLNAQRIADDRDSKGRLSSKENENPCPSGIIISMDRTFVTGPTSYCSTNDFTTGPHGWWITLTTNPTPVTYILYPSSSSEPLRSPTQRSSLEQATSITNTTTHITWTIITFARTTTKTRVFPRWCGLHLTTPYNLNCYIGFNKGTWRQRTTHYICHSRMFTIVF